MILNADIALPKGISNLNVMFSETYFMCCACSVLHVIIFIVDFLLFSLFLKFPYFK